MGDRVTIGTLDELRRDGMSGGQGWYATDLRVLE